MSVPVDFLYQITDPATNALTGTPDTPVSIATGAMQSFLIVSQRSDPVVRQPY